MDTILYILGYVAIGVFFSWLTDDGKINGAAVIFWPALAGLATFIVLLAFWQLYT